MYRNGPLSKNYVPKWYVPKVLCTDMDLPRLGVIKMAITLAKFLSFTVVFASFLAWDYVTQAQKASKDIPSLKLSKFAGPTLTFLFW